MIAANKNAFYYVYPPWARYRFEWHKLGSIFTEPFGSGLLANSSYLEKYWKKIGYEPGTDKFEFIDGPLANGIIKGIGDERVVRYFWMGALMEETSFSRIPGFYFPSPTYSVSWLEQKDSADTALGLKEKAPVYVPKLSLDYDATAGSTVYMSLAVGTKSHDEELCLRVQSHWQSFGIGCRFVEEGEKLPPVARQLVSSVITHRWFALDCGDNDVGLIAAKAFYIGCAAKYVSRRLKSVHLIGDFEGKPNMAQLWNVYRR